MATAFLELWRRRDTVRVVEGSVLPRLLVTTTSAAGNSGRASLRYRKLLSSLQRSEQATAAGRDSQYQDAMDDAAALALRTRGSKDLQLVTLVVRGARTGCQPVHNTRHRPSPTARVASTWRRLRTQGALISTSI
jgi:RNA polymerase sigma-70 factor (ECF subfamily)